MIHNNRLDGYFVRFHLQSEFLEGLLVRLQERRLCSCRYPKLDVADEPAQVRSVLPIQSGCTNQG